MNEEYDVIVLGTGLTVRNCENLLVCGVEAICNPLTSVKRWLTLLGLVIRASSK